jgi:cysteinyl-tRNA synthetase
MQTTSHPIQTSMSDPTGSQILEVNGHQVPAIAYKRIVELWRRGWTESEITQKIKAVCNKNSGAISEVVLGAINDQKFAFTFPNKTFHKEYLDMPLSSPAAIREAELALQKTRTALSRAESTENQNAIEALRLMETRPAFIDEARTYSERMERTMQADQMIRKALQKRQQAEEDILHLQEVKKIRQRLLALSLC